jgi:hypothetical protein
MGEETHPWQHPFHYSPSITAEQEAVTKLAHTVEKIAQFECPKNIVFHTV